MAMMKISASFSPMGWTPLGDAISHLSYGTKPLYRILYM